MNDPQSQNHLLCLNSHANPVSVASLWDLVMLGMNDEAVSSLRTVPKSVSGGEGGVPLPGRLPLAGIRVDDSFNRFFGGSRILP